MIGDAIQRRSFLSLLGGAAAGWPLAVRAQQRERVRRVGVLMPTADSDPEWQAYVAAFREGLRKLGWVDGRNLRIDYRWAAGDAGRIGAYAAELVATSPDAIFCIGLPALALLQQATRTIPVVFAGASDPTTAGLAESLARPGGNITGFVIFEHAIGVKWLELLKQLAPGVARVAFLYDPANPTWSDYLRAIEAGAPSFGVLVSAAAVHNAAEIEQTINAFVRKPNGGLIAGTSPAINVHREQIIALAARYNLPAVYSARMFAKGGGLATYGADLVDQCRSAAGYVDRILKGEKAGDLPIQLPTRYELVVNTKTAKALGLEVPLPLLIRADELIE
jgi:putative tryptophan/tyrosine transport system substrate-binding protein